MNIDSFPLRIVITVIALLCLTSAAPAGAAPAQAAQPRDVVMLLPSRQKVVILPGSPAGLDAARAQRLNRADLGFDRPEGQHDERLSAAASGDINGDGHDDLVVLGITYGDAGPHGVLAVVPGDRRGLRVDLRYHVEPAEEHGGLIGGVHVADLDRDGFDDVVTSHYTPGTYGPPVIEPGTEPYVSVALLWGGAEGLDDDPTLVRMPDAPTYPTDLLIGSGNILGDGRREFVAVEPGSAGYGDNPGLDGRMLTCTVQAHRGVDCTGATRAPAGTTAIAIADLVGDGHDDVALGQPRPDTPSGGGIWISRSDGTRLAASSQITQDSAGISGSDEPGDAFGASLAAADVDGDGMADLAIGAPGENEGMGRAWVLYGHEDGLGLGKDTLLSQNTPGVRGRGEPGDELGAAVALLDVDGSGDPDLLTGAPGEDSSHGALVVVQAGGGRLRPRTSSTLIRAEDAGFAYKRNRRVVRFGEHLSH